ncbi:hypothetical protein [Bradyrhizobium sp. BRP23]|uniref:hypothetical protein n=1 Tax=Bradyrhizobium sp. BRP23 TaxID=2793820 RepID=UPI001CD78A5C|nr:hypothetical protein [Bradyrhizobium sp. BRP23]MCA1381453.1 hypothetical protein [Bradyrhizobium sp. BRP05]MCA1422291.1 hypothetical protein [Bradyrhizobium sp. BRP23]
MSVPPGVRGYYEGTDPAGRTYQIPRHADPKMDGTRLAARHPCIFDVTGPDDSISSADFDARIEKQVPQEVLGRIERTIEAGKFLAARGLADAPPIDQREWRRGMILSWSHARDLVVVHDALGQPRNVANHDMDELVLAKHLQEKLASTPNAHQWYRDYIGSLDEGSWVNVGFFNPNISASMYKWGDAKDGVQNAMDAHRFSAHHQGSPEHPIDWVERAVNFVVHHIPREHRGIRHEPRGDWSYLEERLAEDPAIKNASIGKVIARDAASMFQLLEREGKVIPWQLLRVSPDEITPGMVEHARLVVLAAHRISLLGVNLGPEATNDENEALNPQRVARAEALLKRLPAEIAAARAAGQDDLAATYHEWFTENG